MQLRRTHLKVFILPILLLVLFSCTAQYKINIESHMWRDTSVVLGVYQGDKMLLTDSARFNHKGVVTFEADTLLPQGMYTVYFPDKTYFDLLLGKDQTMQISFPTNNLTADVEIKDSEESQAFADYQKFMSHMQSDRQALLTQYQPYLKNSDSLLVARSKMEILNKKVEQKWEQEINNYPNTYYGLVINSFVPPAQPQFNIADTQKKDSILAALNYNYGIAHYFDNIPLNDERMWRTPFHQKKIEAFLNDRLIPVPDSIIPHAIRLIEASKSDPVAFRNTASTVLNFAVKSEIMGMEALSVAVAKNAYLSGDAYWADSTLLAKLSNLVLREEPALLGKTAHNLVMEDWESGYKSLHQINAPYTILIFWEPECSHCKETIPKLYAEVWNKYQAKGLAVFAVYTQLDKEEWTNFIIDKELFGWNHVYDPTNQSNFRAYFNVDVTPKIYLLDKNKKIVGKNIGVENLDKMLNRLYLYGKLY